MELYRQVTYAGLRALRYAKGLPWFTKPWDLNLVILRSGVVGVWDDLVAMACIDDSGREVLQLARATGDAWEGEWTNPTHPDGCVWVTDQHVPRGFVLGDHKGRPALRQPYEVHFEYVRWPRSMGRVPSVAELEAQPHFMAYCGTHLHNRHNGRSPAKPRPDDSEGCTVNLYRHEHAAIIELVKVQKEVHGTAVVSPTFAKLSDLGWNGPLPPPL